MVVGVDVTVTILGLAKFILDLTNGLRGLVGSVPKCQSLVESLETLQSVLKEALKEYELFMSVAGAVLAQELGKILLRCVQDCDKTCKAYDATLTKILQSKVRPLLWKISQDDLKDLAARLEANKSTLLINLSTIRYANEFLKF